MIRPSTCVAFLALLLVPVAVSASPWTLPQGDLALKLSTDVQYADREFLQTGDNVPFSLDGSFWSGHFRSDLRYGITDRFEIGGQLSFDYVSYQADEVFFGDQVVDTSAALGSQESIAANIVSVDRTAAGLGDIRLFFRNRLTPLGRAVVATEFNVKIPSGYTQPTGTFVNDDPAQGVGDDVALGDGQTDISGLLLMGFSPTWDMFIRVDLGARYRLFGPAPQVLAGFKTGYRVSSSFLPYVQLDATISIGEGDTIGQTYQALDPELPAQQYTLQSLDVQDQTLDRSIVSPGFGMIFTTGNRDIDISYNTVAWGKNVPQLHIFSVGTNLRFDAR
jgi:hypothetical protein